MQAPFSSTVQDIVLVGGGHSHVGVLRAFGMRPVPGVRLTVIATDTHTPYSGMLPGYVAGLYTHDEVHLDLRRLCAFAGARYFQDEVVGLDRQARRVLCAHRPPVAYDWLSINTGSTPQLAQVSGATGVVWPVKPIREWDVRWQALQAQVQAQARRVRVAVVGAGAGGVEMVLAMQQRLQHTWRAHHATPPAVDMTLVGAEPSVLPTHNRWVQASFARRLAAQGVAVHLGQPVVAVQGASPAHLVLADATVLGPFDAVVWVTQAGGPAWLAHTGLACTERGFVRVRPTLQTLSDERIFAAGDVAHWEAGALEKAGVFAVRQGMPLADNLRRSALGQPLKAYRPQRQWLALLGTGQQAAVASRGPWFAQGAWVWRWKDRIDRAFMARFGADLPRMTPAEPMRCGGCGAKVGPAVLSDVLRGLPLAPNPDVLQGLDSPDDAAQVRIPAGFVAVQTVDFFRSMTDDPYLFGRIAAQHALGDVYAMGAKPHTCMAVVTVPPGSHAQVHDTLQQLMLGAAQIMAEAGCTLVGGHTGEGQELALGFSVQGLLPANAQGQPQQAWPKSGLQTGQALILTKPLGTGVIMAAAPTGQAQGRWVDAALATMQVGHAAAVPILQAHGATACTDVTGFGLLGHAAEMARASGKALTLDLASLPLLDGALALSQAGVRSTLYPANLAQRTVLDDPDAAAQHPCFPLLFDPQTTGGLLAAVPPEQADACVAQLRQAGHAQAVVVGVVGASGPATIALRAST